MNTERLVSAVTGKTRTPKLDALVVAEPDLVDRIFAFILEEHPALADRCAELKAAVRAEFRGEECYIRGRPETERQELVAEVFALTFNGKGRRAVARQLGISPSTVSRMLKQPGATDRKRATFPGHGTPRTVASGITDALAAGMAAMVRGKSAEKE
jgi:AraC-like DNA-binding protein